MVKITIEETASTLEKCVEQLRNQVQVEQKRMLDADMLELQLRRMYKPHLERTNLSYRPEFKVYYNKIELIKTYKNATGQGLKESKEFIESMFGT